MAQTVHLKLFIDKKAVEGESAQQADERKGTIECVAFDAGVTAPVDAGDGHPTGRRQYAPVVVRKRIDKTTPRLAEALAKSLRLEATFRFYRPSSNYQGTDENFLTVTIGRPSTAPAGPNPAEAPNAYVSGIRLVVPDTLESPKDDPREAYEEVSFTFDDISWEARKKGEDKTDSLVHDSWSNKPV
jgi:type VI secretion system secreted protein Hcp